jgi:hypothetical protein
MYGCTSTFFVLSTGPFPHERNLIQYLLIPIVNLLITFILQLMPIEHSDHKFYNTGLFLFPFFFNTLQLMFSSSGIKEQVWFAEIKSLSFITTVH